MIFEHYLELVQFYRRILVRVWIGIVGGVVYLFRSLGGAGGSGEREPASRAIEILNERYARGEGDLPAAATVGASVAFTAVAAVWFWWLRDRSRSLVAPMLAHWSTNGLGYLFAWWAWNR